ncbi:XrtA/PEP-CTERM system histidine kinase PrsK [Aurantiacibacter spongiae]|uniref:XrtA/PEP-CTERM system histidine kinase PrsK n=1 Tax=Aurantiacibacter spongiae TaxID=2488860 RepID=UPI0013151676|nr:XrtA/PEP-CTERM system histidine kinase PrsK [Aurantiacibacter spongiae]
MIGPVWNLLVYCAYLLAAGAAIALALWLATGRQAKGIAGRATAAALLVNAAWAVAVATAGEASLAARTILACTNLAWIWMLYRLFGHDERDKHLGPIRPVVFALAFVELLQFAMIAASVRYQALAGADVLIARFALTLRLLFCVGGLVLVHNLYAGASQQAREALRWPAAALGGVWLYDLNVYTIAYLGAGTPALLWQLRAGILLLAVALLAVGTLRSKSDLRFRPSRSFAFQSFSLLLIGAYLVVMVVVAQGLSYLGTGYANVLQTGFVLLASALALTVLPSKRLRGWLRVTVAKNLFQHRYDYRAEWLRFTDTIGRAGPEAPPLPERAVQAVADITDSPAGLLLTPREEGGLALAARWQWTGIDVPARALDMSGARYFEQSQFILDLDDTRKGRTQTVPASATPAWLTEDARAWAMIPLLHYERLVGLVVLARPLAARRLDWEDFDLLRVVGRQLASYLAEASSQDALGEAQRFDEFNRRMAFVMHDIKNLASQLSLLAKNAEKHAEKPEFRADMILTLRNSTDKLTGLLARLNRYGAHSGRAKGLVDLSKVMRRVARQFRTNASVSLVEQEHICATGDAEALEQALVHLVQNGIEAGGATGQVVLTTSIDGGHALIEIADTGAGMSPEFIRTRLFKPFHSSKPGGFGIGAFEARELVRGMGGTIDVESREALGTRFLIRLPLAEMAAIRTRNPEKTSEIA